jgi:hypothetical protein
MVSEQQQKRTRLLPTMLHYSNRRYARIQVVQNWVSNLKRPQSKLFLPVYQPPLSYNSTDFDINTFVSKSHGDECKHFMRFTKEEIEDILPYLRLDLIEWTNRYNPHPMTAFCLLLYRLSYPRRLADQQRIFGRSRAWLSSVFNDIIQHLVVRYRHLLFWDQSRLNLPKLQEYASVIESVCGIPRIWAFVDGTIRLIARPGIVSQQPFYLGYKKCHGFKYQAISTLTGLYPLLLAHMKLL